MVYLMIREKRLCALLTDSREKAVCFVNRMGGITYKYVETFNHDMRYFKYWDGS